MNGLKELLPSLVSTSPSLPTLLLDEQSNELETYLNLQTNSINLFKTQFNQIKEQQQLILNLKEEVKVWRLSSRESNSRLEELNGQLDKFNVSSNLHFMTNKYKQ